MNSKYNTINLFCDANFEIEIYPGVYWVPVATLGKTRYTNDVMKSLSIESIDLEFPYELIQYLQCVNFVESSDSTIFGERCIEWQEHISGSLALKMNRGRCASLAGIFTYLLHDKFTTMGTIAIISNSGVGPALNYIIDKGFYYFIDLYTQINSNVINVPLETGVKSDFVRTKYVTGVCLKCTSIHNFTAFFERYNCMKKREFLYLLYDSELCPPMSLSSTLDCDGDITADIILPYEAGIEVLDYGGKKIRHKFEVYSGDKIIRM